MKREILSSVLLWLTVVLVTMALVFFTGQAVLLAALLCLIALPVLTWGLNCICLRHRMAASIVLPLSGQKGQPAAGQLTVENHSRMPAPRLLCTLQVENLLTGEKARLTLHLSAPQRGKGAEKFSLTTDHCGQLRVTVQRLWAMDWLGLLPVQVQTPAKARITVYPQLFSMELLDDPACCAGLDSEQYADGLRGSDPTEVFSLRDYAPGDSLRQIHWKLSCKLDRPVVREASMPVVRSLLVFWDKSGQPDAAAMDTLAEVTVCLCQTLCDAGIGYTIGWNEPAGCRFLAVNGTDDLLCAASALLKTGAVSQLPPPSGNFGRVVYCAARLTAEAEEFLTQTHSRLLLYSRETAPTNLPAIVFQNENYLQILQHLELPI